MLRRLVLALVAGIVLAGGGLLSLHWQVTRPGPAEAGLNLVIPKGSGVAGIAAQMEAAGVVRSRFWLMAAAAAPDPAKRSLKAGEYALGPHVSAAAIVDLLRSGKVVIHKLTVPEGLTNMQVAALVKAEPDLSGEIGDLPPEGHLMPETYHFTLGDPRAGLIARMRQAMDQWLAQAWAQHEPDLAVTTPEEALTLASIVEKETALAEERPHVAGVFANRLRRGMKLQSDPTVVYAVTDGGGLLPRPLSRADLDDASPYNTYVHAGLPPGPIANPSRESLKAVLSPMRTDDLYFVAKGGGGHAFAPDLETHNRNVRQWREMQKPGGP